MRRLAVVFGTRQEAIKLAPLIQRIQHGAESFELEVCVTAQHREMLDQALELFGIVPNTDLDLMRPNQSLSQPHAAVLGGMGEVLHASKPDLVIVHGDTTTALATAEASFYLRIPLVHVEAGLRSGDILSPFPEEISRRFISKLADLHFAPTPSNCENLLLEG